MYRFECDVGRFASFNFAGSSDEYGAFIRGALADQVAAGARHHIGDVPLKLMDGDDFLAPLARVAEPFLGYGLFCITDLGGEDVREHVQKVSCLYSTIVPGLSVVNVLKVVDCLDENASGEDNAGLPERYEFNPAQEQMDRELEAARCRRASLR